MDKVLVLSSDTWSMTDEKTGEILKGVSIWAINQYREQGVNDREVGYKPAKMAATPEVAKQMAGIKLPALCDMAYAMKPGAGGKAALILTSVSNPIPVDIFAMPKSAPTARA